MKRISIFYMSDRGTEIISPQLGTALVSVPLAMPEALAWQLDAVATAVGLSEQDTITLALERGLPLLLAKLTEQQVFQDGKTSLRDAGTNSKATQPKQ
jgi:hypothetical protein